MPTIAILETFSDLLVFSISQGKGMTLHWSDHLYTVSGGYAKLGCRC
jgi:hypothetical protein